MVLFTVRRSLLVASRTVRCFRNDACVVRTDAKLEFFKWSVSEMSRVTWYFCCYYYYYYYYYY